MLITWAHCLYRSLCQDLARDLDVIFGEAQYGWFDLFCLKQINNYHGQIVHWSFREKHEQRESMEHQASDRPPFFYLLWEAGLYNKKGVFLLLVGEDEERWNIAI